MDKSLLLDSSFQNNKLLNEIGHEFKNKLGIIGSTLRDLHSGYNVDKDSINDAINVYQHILAVTQLLTNCSILIQDSSEISELDQTKKYLETYFKIILAQKFSGHGELEKLYFSCRIDSSSPIAFLEVNIPKNSLLANSNKISTFIISPSNSLEVVYRLLLSRVLGDAEKRKISVSITTSEQLILEEFDIPSH